MKTKRPNEPMDRMPMPSALLSHILLTQAVRQKQVGIGHRGRSAEIKKPLEYPPHQMSINQTRI
jgi:hypothetical protein